MIDIYRTNVNMPVDISDPVNRHHSLNIGLASWWRAVPGLDGGRFIYDLMGLSPGTLTAMTTSASGWRGATYPGGEGALQFDGVDDYVDLGGGSQIINGKTNTTTLFWGYRSSTGIKLMLCRPGAATTRFGIYAYSDNNIYAICDTGSGQAYNSAPETLTGWHHFAMVYDGSQGTNQTKLLLYIDGLPVTYNATFGTIPSSVPAGGNMTMGSDGSGSFGFTTGQIDDVRLFTRSLNAVEVYDNYIRSKQGYPGALNRIAPMFFSISSSGTVFTYSASASISSSVTINKGVARIISPTSALSSTISKGISRVISPTISESVTINKTPSRILSQSTSTSATINKNVGKLYSLSSSLSATVNKGISRLLSASSSLSVSITGIKAKLVNLACSISSSVSLNKIVGRTYSLTSTISPTVNKLISRAYSLTVTPAVSLVKNIAKTLVTNSVSFITAITSLVTSGGVKLASFFISGGGDEINVSGGGDEINIGP